MQDELGPGDYYYDENGLMVLTERYLRSRGYCCENRCRHCPYKAKPEPTKQHDS